MKPKSSINEPTAQQAVASSQLPRKEADYCYYLKKTTTTIPWESMKMSWEFAARLKRTVNQRAGIFSSKKPTTSKSATAHRSVGYTN